MKQVILFVLLGFVLNTSMAQKYAFKLKGDIINVKDGKVELYSPVDSVNALLSTGMKDGIFTLSGKLEEPGYYILNVAGVKFPVVLDGKDMTLYGDYLLPDTKLLKGSPGVKTRLEKERLYHETFETQVNDSLTKYYRMTENGQKPSAEAEVFMMNAIQKASGSWRDALLEFFKQHPDDLYIPILIVQEMGKNVAWGQKAYDLLTPKVQASQPGRLLKKALGKE